MRFRFPGKHKADVDAAAATEHEHVYGMAFPTAMGMKTVACCTAKGCLEVQVITLNAEESQEYQQLADGMRKFQDSVIEDVEEELRKGR